MRPRKKFGIRNRSFEEVVDEAAKKALDKEYPLEAVNAAKVLCRNFIGE